MCVGIRKVLVKPFLLNAGLEQSYFWFFPHFTVRQMELLRPGWGTGLISVCQIAMMASDPILPIIIILNRFSYSK